MSNQPSGLLAGAHPVMAIGSALLVLGFVIFTIVDPQYAASVYSGAKSLHCQRAGLVLHRPDECICVCCRSVSQF